MTDASNDDAFRKRVAFSFLYTGVGNAVSKIVNVVALLIAIKLVTKEQFGAASLVLAAIAILRSVTEMSLGVALVQAKELRSRDVHSLFWLSLLVSLLFYALLALVGAPLFAWFYDEPELAALLRVHSLTIIVFSFYFVSRTLMERELLFGRMAIIDNVALTAGSAVMILLAMRGWGAWSFVCADVAYRLVQALLSQLARPYLPRWNFRVRQVWHMVTFGGYAAGSRLLYNFYTQADYLIVGKIFGPEELAIYTIAYRVISDPVKALATVVNQVAYPAFARLQEERERLERYFFTIARLSLALIGLILVAVLVFIDLVLEGFGYQRYMAAVPLMYVFGFMGLLQAAAPLVPQLLNAVGRPRQNFLYSASCAVTLPIAFFVGAQVALAGVAVAWLVGYPLVVLLLFWFGARALEISLGRMLVGAFSGLVVLVPVALVAVALRLLLTRALALDPALAALLGIGGTLLIGGGVAFLRERADLRSVRRGLAAPKRDAP